LSEPPFCQSFTFPPLFVPVLAAVTVTAQVAVLLPSVVVTVIVAVPAFTPVTFPAELTVATAVSPDVHVTVWSDAVVGLTVAVSVSLDPAVRDSVDLFKETPVTETVAAVTVTAQVAVLLPSVVVTVIVAVPAFTPVTFPAELTVATAVSPDVHVTVWSDAVVGLTVAVSVSLDPAVRDSVDLFKETPVTETVAAVTVTVHVAVLLPSVVVTVMVAEPAVTPETVPPLTVATDVLLELQDTVWSVAVVGLMVAVRVSLEPAVRDSVVLLRETLVTETVESSSSSLLLQDMNGSVSKSKAINLDLFILNVFVL